MSEYENTKRPGQHRLNESKSQWVPTKCMVWLNFEPDLDQDQLRTPETKLQALLSQLAKVIDAQGLPAKVLASIIGKVVAMASCSLGYSDPPDDA